MTLLKMEFDCLNNSLSDNDLTKMELDCLNNSFE